MYSHKPESTMKWITREKPKIDRIACPWLIKNFIDSEAEFYFVPFADVLPQAAILGAIPFDIPNVELSHINDKCTFDALLKKYHLSSPALLTMADIIRGADTDRHDISPYSAGLWAISAGLAYNFQNDYELLQHGFMLYDALYSWALYLQKVKHIQNPFEDLLVNVFQKVITQHRKTPTWAKELKDILQDQIDTNLALSLKDISKELDINPAYLSREFSKYFENLSYGEYIRKLRVEKAIELLETTNYTLTEIAYHTGFSDQSHFTRIFKSHTGQNPSFYRKMLRKSNSDTKG